DLLVGYTETGQKRRFICLDFASPLILFCSRPRVDKPAGARRGCSYERNNTVRPFSGRLGNDDSPYAETAAYARLCARTRHQAKFAGSASDRRRLLVSSAPTPSQRR